MCPISLDTPTIRPPTATDLQTDQTSAPSGAAIAPPAIRPTYETDPGVFRAEGSAGELSDFASQGLQTPGRFDSDLVSDIGRNIDLELAEKQKYAGADLDEFISQRGLVGSNIELDARRSMIGDFERQRSERMTAVELATAQTWATDRQSAADIGFRSGEFERSLGGDRENAERFGAEFGEGQYRFDVERGLGGQQLEIQRRALELQETGMNLDEAFRQAQSEIATGQFESSQTQRESEFSRQQTTEQRAQDLQQRGMDQADAFRYAELAQDAGFRQKAFDLQEQGMSLDEAYRRAELETNEEQFARSMGLDEAQFAEQTSQFAQQHSEAIATRLQQEHQFGASLAETQANRSMEDALRTRALELQETGMSQDEAFRQAELAIDKEMQDRSLALQEQGLSQEDAFRYAALEQDDKFQQQAQDLQSQGMALDEAYRRSELDLGERQFAESASQFDETQRQQASQFARQMGLSEAEFAQQSEEFEKQHAEAIATRLQQDDQFAASLKDSQAGRAMENALRSRSLDLQAEGIALDEAYRRTALKMENTIKTRALALEELGMAKDDAYRYSALEQDARFQERAQDLQETGMSLDEAYRRTEQEYQQWYREEDLLQRERQYMRADDTERLNIILDALASGEVSAARLGTWLDKMEARAARRTATGGSDAIGEAPDATGPEPVGPGFDEGAGVEGLSTSAGAEGGFSEGGFFGGETGGTETGTPIEGFRSDTGSAAWYAGEEPTEIYYGG